MFSQIVKLLPIESSAIRLPGQWVEIGNYLKFYFYSPIFLSAAVYILVIASGPEQ